jgi:hypothetical protein
MVLTVGLQLVLSCLGLYMATGGFKNWCPTNYVMGAAQVAAIVVPQIVASIVGTFLANKYFCYSNMEAYDFIEMASIEGPFKIQWYVAKDGIYHYFIDDEKEWWHTKYKEPLEFPANCELIQIR